MLDSSDSVQASTHLRVLIHPGIVPFQELHDCLGLRIARLELGLEPLPGPFLQPPIQTKAKVSLLCRGQTAVDKRENLSLSRLLSGCDTVLPVDEVQFPALTPRNDDGASGTHVPGCGD